MRYDIKVMVTNRYPRLTAGICQIDPAQPVTP